MATAFTTHTGLLIALEQDEDDYVVTITGDLVKELLRTPVREAAEKFYDGLVENYEDRAKAEAT